MERPKKAADEVRASGSGLKASRQTEIKVKSAVPKRRQDLLKWNGWGYKDSGFEVVDEKLPLLGFVGSRYPISGSDLPYFTDWVVKTFNVNLHSRIRAQPLPPEHRYPQPHIDERQLQELQALGVSYSVEGVDRLVRSHGHTLYDMFVLRESFFDRIPDVVVWPESHDDVVGLVELANRLNMVVIPFGGGTSVSGAVSCPANESRPIISLDTTQMNRILWLDEDNLTVCCESGILGQDLERELQARGYTVGHEPDSVEFSTVGGWVATRSSGMKKNIYGNIEDLMVHVKMVTPTGVLEKGCQVPRMSCGPDFNHVVLGSEGTLGVVTEVVLKIRPVPNCKRYGSIVFPDFEKGVDFMREVARQRCQPASVRLMDNVQFVFGQVLRPPSSGTSALADALKKLYVTKIKGFDVGKMCVATLLFEGEPDDVRMNERKLYRIASQYGGLPAGEKNGERGYTLTYVIAYIRDLACEYGILAESFETSVPWDRASLLCRNVKARVAQECDKYAIKYYMISCRVTQTYDAGCCIYFYFGFNYSHLKDPVGIYEEIENTARDEIIACGGSISHHHGVGKMRKRWYPETVSEVGVTMFEVTKANLDPNNIFASGNLTKKAKL